MLTTVQNLIDAGDRLFGKRDNLLSFWQDVADNFNPAGADYTSTRTLGEDYASDLMTSYPLLVARDLTDNFSAMLRPSDRPWFNMEVEGLADHEGKAWLQWASGVQRRAMYDRRSMFVTAAKDGDRDFGLMGQAVISVELNPDGRTLLYRSWHLRDVAWTDGIDGATECVHRKWNSATAHELSRFFGAEKLHPKVQECLQAGKDPYKEISVRHIVMPTSLYHGETKFRTPLVSIFIDVDHQHLIEVTGQRVNPYVIPRWQRLKGTQYAVSPATVCALPETRLLQAMTFTLLEAGEKYTNPPLIATQEMIRSDIDVMAGGITWVSADYDERLGEVLRPLTQDKSGLPLGLELQQRSEMMIRSAFYLDRLTLPARGPDMTAYEVSQRVQEYIRNTLPLFEPMEVDYNGGLCERTFDVLLNNGGFGPPDSLPKSLLGEEIDFKFASPLRDAVDKEKGQIFLSASELVAQAASLDPGAPLVVNASEALRDALEGIGVPVKWMNSREDAAEMQASQAAQAQQEKMLAMVQQGAAAVADLSKARAA